MENYKTPKNCDQLLPHRVNPEIWGRLPSSAMRTDINSSYPSAQVAITNYT